MSAFLVLSSLALSSSLSHLQPQIHHNERFLALRLPGASLGAITCLFSLGVPWLGLQAHAPASPLPASSSHSGHCPARGCADHPSGKPRPWLWDTCPHIPAARGPSTPDSIAAQHARLLCSWNRLEASCGPHKEPSTPTPPLGRHAANTGRWRSRKWLRGVTLRLPDPPHSLVEKGHSSQQPVHIKSREKGKAHRP